MKHFTFEGDFHQFLGCHNTEILQNQKVRKPFKGHWTEVIFGGHSRVNGRLLINIETSRDSKIHGWIHIMSNQPLKNF